MELAEVARWVRRRRRALGLTQADLRARAGVSLATVQGIEAGTANPAFETLRRVLEALGLCLDVRPRDAAWDVLAHFGLPLAGAEGSEGAREIEDLPDAVRAAALELRGEEERGDGRQRRRESLEALLLALRLHFPSLHERWFGRAPAVLGLVPGRPSGRVVKLARVARALLARRL